jgi:hypothetical protein
MPVEAVLRAKEAPPTQAAEVEAVLEPQTPERMQLHT